MLIHHQLHLGALVPFLALGALLLSACDSGEAKGDTGTRIEDLPPEARVVTPEGRTVEDADEFLGMLSFDPLYPSELPAGLVLAHAEIQSSPFARDGEDPQATLSLEYSNEETFITVTQRMQDEAGEFSGAATEEVQVGPAEGLLIEFGPDAQQLAWYDCGRTLSVTASAYDGDELIAIGESMTEGC